MKGFSDILVLLLVIIPMIVAGMFFFHYFKEFFVTTGDVFLNMSATDFGNSSSTYNATKSVRDATVGFLNTGDFLLGSLFFGSILFILLSALLVRFSPLFLPAYVIFTLLATWMSVTFKGALLSILQSFPWTANFPITSNIIMYLPIIIGVVGGLVILLQYAFRNEVF